MAVKIRLKRMGKIRAPFYRIVVADAHKKRDGRVIEEIGTYNPKTEPSTIHVVNERAQYWLSVGAQPTEAVAAILNVTGASDGKSELKEPEPKQDKEQVFQAALKEFYADTDAAGTASQKSMKKAKSDDKAKSEGKAKKADASAADAQNESGHDATADQPEETTEA